jgi:pimeloyl-ACP methyl ester carboxylesterase
MRADSLSINDRELHTPDGTRIAYAIAGSGPALVLTNGLTTTTTFWKYLRPIWLQRHTIVTWDMPGHGNSSPAASDASATIEAQASFIAQLMRATGIARATHIGWSTGSQVVLELYRQRPELCDALVMVLGGAGHALDPTRLPLSGALIDRLTRALPPPLFAASARLLSGAFQHPRALPLARWFDLIGPRVSPQDAAEITAHIASVEPATLQRLLHSCQAHDARAALASLRVPLLIVAGDKDPFAPSERVGVSLQRDAPGSELLRLANGTHTAMLEEPERIAHAVEGFLEPH